MIFRPWSGSSARHGLKPSLAAGVVVLGLLAVGAVVVIATAQGVIDQTAEIGDSVDAAIAYAVDELGLDQAHLDDVRTAIEEASPEVTGGFVTKLVSGVDALLGVASGLILGALIMYYLLKDGARLRRSVVAQIDPRSGARSTASSVRRAGSSATTGGAAPPCPRSWRWSSPSPP